MYKIKNILLLTLLAMLSSCGAQMSYTSHQCNFIFNTEMHPGSLLQSSIQSYDGFCLVYKNNNKVYVEKYGQTDPNSPYTYTSSVEPKVSELVIGYDNGLLMGYSPFDNTILAFDRCCPKCENSAGGKLQWNGSTSSVKCPNCGTEYNLTIAGNGLSRYPATFDGIYIKVVHM